jgi:hypothetical protein
VIELIFLACLRTDALQCEERSKLYLADVGIMGCMVTAQAELALWSDSHPAFRVSRWSCRWADPSRLGA